MVFESRCNQSFFNFRGAADGDQAPPTNFSSRNAFISCLKAGRIFANNREVVTGAVNIGVGIGIIPDPPNDISAAGDINHKSIDIISPIVGSDDMSTITISGPTLVEGPFPATSTDDGVVCWDGTTGRLVKDSTVLCSTLLSGPTPATSTDNAVVVWDGTTGRLIKDSTLIANSPSTGGLTLAGNFQVPGTKVALTFTNVSALTPIVGVFTGSPIDNFIARFGNVVFILYRDLPVVLVATATTAAIATVPLAFVPNPPAVTQQLSFTVTVGGIGTISSSSSVMLRCASSPFAGRMDIEIALGGAPIPTPDIVDVRSIYWDL